MVSENGSGVVDLVSVGAEAWAIKSPPLSSVVETVEESPSLGLREVELVHILCTGVIDGGLEGKPVEGPAIALVR